MHWYEYFTAYVSLRSLPFDYKKSDLVSMKAAYSDVGMSLIGANCFFFFFGYFWNQCRFIRGCIENKYLNGIRQAHLHVRPIEVHA